MSSSSSSRAEGIYLFRMVLLGNADAKRNVRGFLRDNQGAMDYLSTIGQDFLIRTIENFKFIIFDTAGQERFRNITRNYYRDAAALLVCPADMADFIYWRDEIINHANDSVIVVISDNEEIKAAANAADFIAKSLPAELTDEQSINFLTDIARNIKRPNWNLNQLEDYYAEIRNIGLPNDINELIMRNAVVLSNDLPLNFFVEQHQSNQFAELIHTAARSTDPIDHYRVYLEYNRQGDKEKALHHFGMTKFLIADIENVVITAGKINELKNFINWSRDENKEDNLIAVSQAFQSRVQAIQDHQVYLQQTEGMSRQASTETNPVPHINMYLRYLDNDQKEQAEVCIKTAELLIADRNNALSAEVMPAIRVLLKNDKHLKLLEKAFNARALTSSNVASLFWRGPASVANFVVSQVQRVNRSIW
jgi:hypothetical protein